MNSPNILEWPTTVKCAHPEYYHSTGELSSEIEVSIFIGALVRLLQPELVLETGSFKGQTTWYIADALMQNGHGHLFSIEKDENLLLQAQFHCQDFRTVSFLCGDSLNIKVTDAIDLAYFDAGQGRHRLAEFDHFYPYLTGFVAFHDTDYPGYPIRETLVSLEEQGKIKFLDFPTPFGLALCKVIH